LHLSLPPFSSCSGNAKIAGLTKDLKLERNDFNIVLTAFYIAYVLFEIPSNMVCKIIGPGWYIPTLTLGFGIISVCMSFTHNISDAAAIRFLLGIFESGMMPGIAYYLSRWYRRSELTFRLSLYIVMAPLAGAFGGLLASGILKLSHFGGLHSWRMLFAIEGIITIGLSLIAYFTLTDRPSTARWLTSDERDLAIARIKAERVSTTEVLDKIDTPKILKGIFSPVTLSTAFIFLLDNITVQGLAFFLPTIIATIYPKNSVIYQQLKTVPPYLVGGVSSYYSIFFASLTLTYIPVLHRTLSLLCLEIRPPQHLLHHMRTPHDDRLHLVPRVEKPTRSVRRHLLHRKRCLQLRCALQRSS